MLQIKCQNKDHKQLDCEWICLEENCQHSRFLCQYCILQQQQKRLHKNINFIYQKQQVDNMIGISQSIYNKFKTQIDSLQKLIDQFKMLINKLEHIINQYIYKYDLHRYFKVQSREDYNLTFNFLSSNLKNDGTLNEDCPDFTYMRQVEILRERWQLDDMKNQLEQFINIAPQEFPIKSNNPKIKIISLFDGITPDFQSVQNTPQGPSNQDLLQDLIQTQAEREQNDIVQIIPNELKQIYYPKKQEKF